MQIKVKAGKIEKENQRNTRQFGIAPLNPERKPEEKKLLKGDTFGETFHPYQESIIYGK